VVHTRGTYAYRCRGRCCSQHLGWHGEGPRPGDVPMEVVVGQEYPHHLTEAPKFSGRVRARGLAEMHGRALTDAFLVQVTPSP
jgi:hypothetical protein